MSSKPTQRGNRSYVLFVTAAGVLFVHGITSSLLLKLSHCSQLARIADIILVTIILLIISSFFLLRLKKSSPMMRKPPWFRSFVLFMFLYCCWILLRGWQTHAGLRETLLALFLDTALFWGVLFAATLPDRHTKENTIEKIVKVITYLSFGAIAIYFLGISRQFDSLIGYGQCGSEPFLRTGGFDGWIRSRGFARNPNELGALLVIPISFLLYRLNQKAQRTRYASALLVTALLLFLTFSRSAWLAAGVSSLLLFVKQPSAHSSLDRKWLIALVIGFLMFGGVTLKKSQLFNQLVLHKSAASDSTSQHWKAKKYGLQYTANHPWGAGPGSAGAVGAALQEGPSIETESAFLDISVQYGWIGLLIFTTLLINLFNMVSLSTSTYRLPIACGLVGLTIAGLVIPVWSNFPVSLLAGLFAGLTLYRPLPGASKHM